MENYKKIGIFFALILLVGLLAIKYLPQEESSSRSENRLRVGAGDDITGVLLDEITKMTLSIESNSSMEDYSFKDC